MDMPEEDLKETLELLKKAGINIVFENPILEEIKKALEFGLGGLKTRLAIEEDGLKELSKGAKSTFEDSCVAIEGVLNRTINESVSLRKYIALEKQAKTIVSDIKRQNNKKTKR